MDEKEFLSKYRPADFPRPSVAVDLTIFTVVDTDLKVLLVRRGEHPYQNALALPGGFLQVDRNEDLEQATANLHKNSFPNLLFLNLGLYERIGNITSHYISILLRVDGRSDKH